MAEGEDTALRNTGLIKRERQRSTGSGFEAEGIKMVRLERKEVHEGPQKHYGVGEDDVVTEQTGKEEGRHGV